MPSDLIRLGDRVVYCPNNGLKPRFVQVCGLTSNGLSTTFLVREVKPDGSLGVALSADGKFKSGLGLYLCDPLAYTHYEGYKRFTLELQYSK